MKKLSLTTIYSLALFILGSIVLVSCFGDGGKDYVETVVEEPTQGVFAEIEEVKENIFKINNEEILDKREDSRIIASFMDGTIDTFTLDEISLTTYNDPRRSALRSVAMGGMMGYFMGRSMGSGLSRNSYANDKAFNKSSTTGTSKMRSTATRKTVRTAKAKTKSKSGFGSKKSTRSYGG